MRKLPSCVRDAAIVRTLTPKAIFVEHADSLTITMPIRMLICVNNLQAKGLTVNRHTDPFSPNTAKGIPIQKKRRPEMVTQ